MRLLAALVVGVVLPAGVFGQVLSLKTPVIQHVAVEPSRHPSAVARGSAVTLSVVVTPQPGIHVYAKGATEFTPVALVMTPTAGITMGRPRYPDVGPDTSLTAMADPAPAYHARFRVDQPITVTRAVTSGGTLRLSGALNYQACDDRLCYPAASIPVLWTLTVR